MKLQTFKESLNRKTYFAVVLAIDNYQALEIAFTEDKERILDLREKRHIPRFIPSVEHPKWWMFWRKPRRVYLFNKADEKILTTVENIRLANNEALVHLVYDMDNKKVVFNILKGRYHKYTRSGLISAVYNKMRKNKKICAIFNDSCYLIEAEDKE